MQDAVPRDQKFMADLLAVLASEDSEDRQIAAARALTETYAADCRPAPIPFVPGGVSWTCTAPSSRNRINAARTRVTGVSSKPLLAASQLRREGRLGDHAGQRRGQLVGGASLRRSARQSQISSRRRRVARSTASTAWFVCRPSMVRAALTLSLVPARGQPRVRKTPPVPDHHPGLWSLEALRWLWARTRADRRG
jgi:hypothetical protein